MRGGARDAPRCIARGNTTDVLLLSSKYSLNACHNMIPNRNEHPYRKRRRWTLFALFVLLMFYPFEITVAPVWRIRVVDEEGHSIEGVAVEQSWQHAAAWSGEREQKLSTNSDGYVTFPRRTVRISLLLWLIQPVFGFLEAGVHGDFGSFVFITVQESIEYESAGFGGQYLFESLPDQIELRRKTSANRIGPTRNKSALPMP